MTILRKIGKGLSMTIAGLLGLVPLGVALFFALVLTDQGSTFRGDRSVYLALGLGGALGALATGWAMSVLWKNHFWKAFALLVFAALVCYPGVAIILSFVELSGVRYSP